MVIRYTVANLGRHNLGKLINPSELAPGVTPMTTDTPGSTPSLQPQPMAQPEPQRPSPGAPSQMIQPEKVLVVNQPPSSPPPEAPVGPQPRWVNEGGHDLTRTLLATGTVAALAIAGIYFFK